MDTTEPAPAGATGHSSGTATARGLSRLHRYLVRPLFWLITFLAILVAAFQVSGRIAMATLHLYADDLNTLAADAQIRLTGVTGAWRGLNPVVRVEQVAFPAGSIAALDLELDVLESVWRNVLVPRRVHADAVHLNVEQTAQGWRLAGMEGDREMPDVSATLRHLDDLSVPLEIHFTNRDGERGDLEAHVLMTNVDAQHFLGVRIGTLGDGLNVRVWQHDEVLWMQPARTAVAVAGSLSLPEVVTGMSALSLGVQEGWWSDQDGYGGGRLALEIAGLEVPGVAEQLILRTGLVGERSGSDVSALVDTLRVDAVGSDPGSGALDLAGMRFGVNVGEPPSALRDWLSSNALHEADDATGPPLLRIWLQRLVLDDVTELFATRLAGWDPAGSWVAALAPRGELLNVHAYFDPQMQPALGYAATLSDLAVDGHKGAPTLRGGQGQIWGHDHGVAVQLSAQDTELQFPDLFSDLWQVAHLQGVIEAWFAPGYLALRGDNLKATIGDSQVAGSFSLARPNEPYEQRVGLTLNLDNVGLAESRSFVPYKIPPELQQWLDTGPRAGQLSDIRFAYHGQVRVEEGDPGRRIELQAHLAQGTIAYDPVWPVVSDLRADVHVAGTQTRIRIAEGMTSGARLGPSDITLYNNGAYAAGRIDASGDAADMLSMVHASPLRDALQFVTPAWRASGEMRIAGELSVPIRAEQSPPLAVGLQFRLDGVDLLMPEYRSDLRGLTGSGRFALPHEVAGAFEGQMFSRPVAFVASSDADRVYFDITGSATPADVYELIDYPDIGVLSGEFDFSARLALAMQPDLVTGLELTSALEGLAIDLPAQFAKQAADMSPTELDVQFLPDYQSVRWAYEQTQGWIHFGDGIERGAIGVGEAPPMTDHTQRAIVIAGGLPELRLSDWVSSDGDSQFSLPLDWIMRDFAIDRFLLDELMFADVVVNGIQQSATTAFAFVSPEVVGEVMLPPDAPTRVDLEYLRLPDTDAQVLVSQGLALDDSEAGDPQWSQPVEDPFPLEVGYALPAAQVSVEQLVLGDQPFGRWRFDIEPATDHVTFARFAVDVNGVHTQDAELVWHLADNTSAFRGLVELDDLAQTLPLWDYAASVQTGSAAMRVDGSWRGSPANVSLLGLNGELKFSAKDGRFLDVASAGGLRIMSLLNFSNIAKRMAFDFSDVTKDGLAFESIDARVAMREGNLTFLERMKVMSSSSNFEVGGSVDLNNGLLNNEMIVTLPVSDSLPWYGVYLALANPLAGLGVLVGERVLRKPIQTFSTAKFEVTGTLEEPEVTFVSLWDRSISAPPEVLPRTQPEQSAPAQEAPAAITKETAAITKEPAAISELPNVKSPPGADS